LTNLNVYANLNEVQVKLLFENSIVVSRYGIWRSISESEHKMAYPTNEQALATFKDEEFRDAVNKRLDQKRSITLVRFEVNISGNDLLVLSSRILTRIADLIDDIPYDCYLQNNDIVRDETAEDAERAVLSDRRSEMNYTESSPYYHAHLSVSDE